MCNLEACLGSVVMCIAVHDETCNPAVLKLCAETLLLQYIPFAMLSAWQQGQHVAGAVCEQDFMLGSTVWDEAALARSSEDCW